MVGNRALILMLVPALLAGCVAGGGSQAGPTGIEKIGHVVVIYQENWSFDSLYGKFPGANGLERMGDAAKQVDKAGTPYLALPQPIDTTQKPPAPDPRFPDSLPVAPFDTSKYVAADQKTGDLVHRFYQEQYQIDSGKMDRYVAWSDAAGLVMSYYDATNMAEGKLAQEYVMADNFFHSAFGGSFVNHFWLVCGCTPSFFHAPSSMVAQLDSKGTLTKDGAVTPDGRAVNTVYTVNTPHPAGSDPASLLPNQSLPTIGDRLNDRGLNWAWYAGGWNDAIAGRADPLFQFHHQPFAYFTNYADGKPAKQQHLKDETDFTAALQSGSLPAVSFVKPLGADNEHPGYTSLQRGQQHVAELVNAVRNSKYWKDTAIVITYDENGGRWDHVAPPMGDRWGPGTRVPAVIVSPYARRHFVDHTQYETISILRFIEHRWGLPALGSRDAAAADLTNAFDFNQQPSQS